MSSGAANRRRGAQGERNVTAYLRANGFPHAERRLSGGPNDTGDINLGPGLVIEVKDRARLELAAWIDQLANEMEAANADIGAIIHRRRGRPNVGEWYATMPVDVLLQLLDDAGWASHRKTKPK